MKAMIFAAGLGTRLKPFTLTHPKALVEVGGKPVLQRVIERLRDEAGVRDIVVNVHHFASQIVDFIKANNSFGVNIKISDESAMLLDTGGGVVAALPLLHSMGTPDEPVMLYNADILSNFPLNEMIHEHDSSHADATLLVQQRDTSRYLLLNQAMRMCGWTNISTGEVRPQGIDTDGLSRFAFGGVHILSADALKTLAAYNRLLSGETTQAGVHKFSIMNFYVEQCLEIFIHGFCPQRCFQWHDVGKPQSLEAARIAFS